MDGRVGWAVHYDGLAIDERTAAISLVEFQILGVAGVSALAAQQIDARAETSLPPSANTPRNPTNISAITLAVFAANTCEHPR